VTPTPKVSAVSGTLPLQPAGKEESEERDDQWTRGASREERLSPLSARELEMQQRGIVRAEVRPARPFLLSLPFPGTLASVEVRDGELVEKDQVLAVLDKQGVERELEEARLAMTAALERVQTMQEFAPKEQEGARENLARSADRLREAEERVAMTSLRAPFAGRVTEIKARAGQHLRRGEAVMELAEQGDLEVISQVPSTWVSRLQPGNIIWVYVEETGKSYEAEFVRFGGRVNPSVRSIRAYSRFVNIPDELLPGMGGRADYFPRQSR
jgi:multidrug resistance efflux pump